MVRLSQAKKRVKYIIQHVDGDSESLSRLNKLGFYPGQTVTLKRKAPLFGNPMLFQIEHGQYALTKNEAALVEVAEADTE